MPEKNLTNKWKRKYCLIHFIFLLDNGYNTKCQNYNQVILKFRIDIYFAVPALNTTIMAIAIAKLLLENFLMFYCYFKLYYLLTQKSRLIIG